MKKITIGHSIAAGLRKRGIKTGRLTLKLSAAHSRDVARFIQKLEAASNSAGRSKLSFDARGVMTAPARFVEPHHSRTVRFLKEPNRYQRASRKTKIHADGPGCHCRRTRQHAHT